MFNSFTDLQLISTIINEPVAKRLLDASDNQLAVAKRLSYNELRKIDGIGKKTAIKILKFFELNTRILKSEGAKMQRVTSSADAYKRLQFIGDLPYEEFHVIYLNRQNKIIKSVKTSQGGVAGTVADLKLIFKYALECLASSIICAHNHPSGNLRPSESDKKLTAKLVEAGKVMDIKVLDHIIVTSDGFMSFADDGMM